MSDIYCKDCRACVYIGGKPWCACRAKDISDVSPKCDCFRRKRPTLFDRITQSPERLAETYMFNYDGKVFKSLLLPNMVFSSREEAIAATVARLKEICND